MSISMDGTLSRVRDLLEGVTGISRVYTASESGADRIPEALVQTGVTALVLPGAINSYGLSGGQHRVGYEVRVDVVAPLGMYVGQAYASVVPVAFAVIEMLTSNVTLSGTVTSCLFDRSTELDFIQYGGEPVGVGVSIYLRVSEQAAATPAGGG